MKPEIMVALELYCEADDLAKDWLIQSWRLKDEEKDIAIAIYRKVCRDRSVLASRLYELTREGVFVDA